MARKAPNEKLNQRVVTAGNIIPCRKQHRQNHEPDSIARLQGVVGNQVLQRLIQPKKDEYGRNPEIYVATSANDHYSVSDLISSRQQGVAASPIQRQDIQIVGAGHTGTLTQHQRRAARSCPITCGTNNLGTLHAMALFYHASRRSIVAAGSANATGVGMALHFIRSSTRLPTSNACHCNDYKIIQVLQNSHPIGTRGNSYVDNAGRSTPFYGDVYRSGSGRHVIPSGYPDAGRRVTTTRSIYDRPQRGTSGRTGQNISWNAEACLTCVKTGQRDRVLGCVTYGFRRNWNTTRNRHDPVQGLNPGCRTTPSRHFVNTLTNDPSTSSYRFRT